MALKKTKTMKNGESGEYWKITSCIPNYQTMTTTYKIELFKDKSYSKIECISGTTKIFTFSTTKEEFASGDLRALGYTKILNAANSIVKPAIEARAAIAPTAFVPPNGNTPAIPATRGSPAITAQSAVYGDEDLKDAIPNS